MSSELNRSILKLYYLIKKAHVQVLPLKVKEFGDIFVLQEFRAHYKKSDPKFMKGFVENWINYYQDLTLVKEQNNLGKDMEESKLSLLSEEQRETLKKIKSSIK